MKEAMLLIMVICLLAGSVTLAGHYVKDAEKNNSVITHTNEITKIDFNRACIGRHIAYIPLENDIRVDSGDLEVEKAIITIIDKFEQEKKVKIISWNIDKSSIMNGYGSDLQGLCVTFEETK